MNLQDQLMEDMKQAMRDKDQIKLGMIRLLRAEVKNKEIDEGALNDADVQKVAAALIKQLKDAIPDFEKAGRTELVEEQTAKIAVLESYLPAQMSDADLEAVVAEAIESLDNPNMGMAMKAVMAKVGGQADGQRISKLVQQKLNS